MDRNYVKDLLDNLSNYCIFKSEKNKILLIAPQKCGSTSIFVTLYNQFIGTRQDYEQTFSHEYKSELCIHTHLKNTLSINPQQLKAIFSDPTYLRILVVRDPVERLCSAICSKYIIKNSPFYLREISSKLDNGDQTHAETYDCADHFTGDFNLIASIILSKGAIFGNEKSSHAAPITELIPRQLLPFFTKIINISNTESWDDLRSTINDHLSQLHISPPLIQRFPKINEGPISSSQRFLSNANLSIAYSRYEQDYNVLKPKHPPQKIISKHSHRQKN